MSRTGAKSEKGDVRQALQLWCIYCLLGLVGLVIMCIKFLELRIIAHFVF